MTYWLCARAFADGKSGETTEKTIIFGVVTRIDLLNYIMHGNSGH